MKDFDWEALARKLGSIQENSADGTYSERGGNALGKLAMEHILGDEFWREAVDFYVDGNRGEELARSVLWYVHPIAAMQRCYEIYKSDADIETRRYALTLLIYVADFRVIDWVEEFLDDPDVEINVWGACMLDQLLQSSWGEPPAKFRSLLEQAENHSSERVRNQINDSMVRACFEKRIDDW